ncbi:MAG: hypothetical protein ACE5FN_02570 [Leptospirillia bacterium]
MTRFKSLFAMFVGAALLMAQAAISVPAMAAGLSPASASQAGSQITTAYLTATQLQRQILDLGSAPLPDSVKTGFAVMDQALAEAERLVNKIRHLAPGLGHVRTNIAAILSAGKGGGKVPTLMDECVIELYALAINSAILEASGFLKEAGDALDKKKSKEAIYLLQKAGEALQLAHDKGAYHIQNDLEEVQAALIEFAGKLNANVPVLRDSVDERIDEVESHLYDVGMEH